MLHTPRRRRSRIVIPMVLALVVIATILLLPRYPRPTLAVANIQERLGTAGKTKLIYGVVPYDEMTRVFWATPNTLVVSRPWMPPAERVAQISLYGGETRLGPFLNSGPLLVSVAPDGQYALFDGNTGWKPGGKIPEWFAHIEALDGSTSVHPRIKDIVKTTGGIAWTRDNRFWMAEGAIGPWTGEGKARRKASGFLAFPREHPEKPPRFSPVDSRRLWLMGMDATNRVLAMDIEATLQPSGGKAYWQQGRIYAVPGLPHLVVDAFPVDVQGRTSAPTRLELPLPPHEGQLFHALAPDGTRIAYLSVRRVSLPNWASSLCKRFWLSPLMEGEIWVARLDGSAPRLHTIFSFPFPYTRSGIRVYQPVNKFLWSPDSKQFGIVEGKEFWTVPAPP